MKGNFFPPLIRPISSLLRMLRPLLRHSLPILGWTDAKMLTTDGFFRRSRKNGAMLYTVLDRIKLYRYVRLGQTQISTTQLKSFSSVELLAQAVKYIYFALKPL